MTFTLQDLKGRPRQEVVFTLECSGNHGHPWFLSGIGTAKWTGTPLAPILQVEVQIDGGPWVPATIDRSEEAEFAWKIWSLDWQNPTPGGHTIASRAIDMAGNIQPAMDDPRIAKKRTYWESNGQVTWRIRIG